MSERETIEIGGSWDTAPAELQESDPAWAETCTKMSTNPWTTGVLPRKFVGLVSIGLNAACANLNADGARRHIRAALLAVMLPDTPSVVQLSRVIAQVTAPAFVLGAVAAIAGLIARDAPFYDATISIEAVDGINRFAMANGLLREPLPYDGLVALQFRALWIG